MERLTIKKPHLIYVVLYIFLLDLFIGGGGRLYDIGIVSPRMYLYTVTVIISALLIIDSKKINIEIFQIIIFFSSTLIFSLVVALINGNPIANILLDIKPLLFFYALIFLHKVINSAEKVIMVANILRVSSVILALSYVLILLLLHFKIIDFYKFYSITNNTSEFFFRGTVAFMYKGFLYLGIGTFFYFKGPAVKHKIITLILIIACVLTFTRGFIISLGAVYFIYIISFGRYKLIKFFFFIAICLAGFILLRPIFESGVLGDKSLSNQVRLIQFSQVMEMISPLSFFTGQGFGQGVEISPVHMEIAYLEIFHKQGLIGLLFWGYLLCIIVFKFVQAYNRGNFEIALPFLLASLFVYIESFTNPFILSPLGMVMIMISIVCLNVIKNSNEHLGLYRHT